MKKSPQTEPINELENQLERSGFFAHSSFSHQAERINEIESFLYGLIDNLIAEDVIDKSTFEEMVQKVKAETLQKHEHFHAGIGIRVDKDDPKIDDFVPVNCEERIPICKAICCKLNFALSIPEIESGNVKWDLGQPYFVRHQKNGICVHMNSENNCCSIYKDRPKVCRKYSCAQDTRIWKNFEKMELNQEWIDNNLQEKRIQLQGIFMLPDEKIEYKSKV